MTLTLKIVNQSLCFTLWCVVLHHTKVSDKSSVVQKILSGKTLILWTFTVTLTLNAEIQFFMTLWLTMVYHKISLDAKGSAVQKISQEQSYFDHMILHHDLGLEDSKPNFLNGTLTYTPPCQIWSPKVEHFRRYHWDKILTDGTHKQTDNDYNILQYWRKKDQEVLTNQRRAASYWRKKERWQ